MPFKTNPRVLAIVMVLASIFSVQLGGSFAKTIFHAVGAEGVTALRQLFSTLLLLAIFRPWNNLPDRKAWGLLALYGGLLGVMNLTFYMAMSRIPLGLAVAVEFVGPLAVAILSSRQWSDIIWVACAVAGLAVLLPLHGAGGAIDLIGVLWALVAAACWGLYIIIGQKVSDRVHGGKAVAIGMALSSLFTIPIGVAVAGAALWEPKMLLLGLGVAVLSGAIPYTLEMLALKHIPAKTFGLMMSLEPAAAALMGWLVLAERLSPIQGLGIALVIVASAGSSLTARRAPAEAVA